MRLWTFDKHYQWIGGSGGAGVGLRRSGRSRRRARANKKHGRPLGDDSGRRRLHVCARRLVDGGASQAPLLAVMHNNRAYHQEVMHLQRMGEPAQPRGVTRAHIGTTLEDPFINYAQIVKGHEASTPRGRSRNPNELAPRSARADVRRAAASRRFVDVVTQPR